MGSDAATPRAAATLRAAATRRVAAIDCGTNSIRLLIADVAPDGGASPGANRVRTVTDVVRTMEVARLGEGVDRTGRLSPTA